MTDTARRLLMHCPDPSIEVEDLVQEARVAIYLRRDYIVSSRDPVASCYVIARQAMIDAIKRTNRGRHQ